MEKRVIVAPELMPNEGKVFDLFPDTFFVGTQLARHPLIAPVIIRQDRERLIQDQE